MGLELELELELQHSEGPTTLRQQGGPAFYTLLVVDCLLLVIFLVEYILRSRALRWKHICSPLGVLDLILLLGGSGYVGLVQFSSIQISGTMLGVVRAVRLLRILRMVHLLQILPALALLVKGLVSTIITIMDAMILLGIISYIGALICSEVLGRKDPQLGNFFSSVPLSFLTHIQLVLVEGWPTISAAMLNDSKFWAAYLVVFICLSNFALLNLVTGVVCERVMELARQLPPASFEEKEFEFEMLKQQVAELYEATPKKKSKYLSQHEYIRLFKSVLANEVLDDLKVTLPSQNDLLQCLIDEDANGKVTCSELQEGLMRLRSNRFDEVSRAMQCTVRKCTNRSFRELGSAERKLKAAICEVFQARTSNLQGQLRSTMDSTMDHAEEQISELRRKEVRKQEKNLMETTYAMKTLSYAIAALQKECSNAFLPSIGALSDYKGNTTARTACSTQTELTGSPPSSPRHRVVSLHFNHQRSETSKGSDGSGSSSSRVSSPQGDSSPRSPTSEASGRLGRPREARRGSARNGSALAGSGAGAGSASEVP
ncbi:Voltage-dependent L-type calcium channel subunit alpha-1F (Voltage-gated calcium channel subunit alpha Cav1.4) [Durusdinium trenchii]